MKFIEKSSLEAVQKAKIELQDPNGLKPYFDHFEETLDYSTIRLALTILEERSSP